MATSLGERPTVDGERTRTSGPVRGRFVVPACTRTAPVAEEGECDERSASAGRRSRSARRPRPARATPGTTRRVLAAPLAAFGPRAAAPGAGGAGGDLAEPRRPAARLSRRHRRAGSGGPHPAGHPGG